MFIDATLGCVVDEIILYQRFMVLIIIIFIVYDAFVDKCNFNCEESSS